MVNSSGPQRRCPECGRDAQDRSVPPPRSLFHWRRTVWLIIPAVIVACGLWLKMGETTMRTGSGTLYPKVILPGIDIEQLRAVADGQASVDLAATILDTLGDRSILDAPGRSRLEVGFVRPKATRTQSFTIGWPTHWYTSGTRRVYDDAVTEQGFQAAATDPSLAALGRNALPRDPLRIPAREPWTIVDGSTLLLQPPPEATGGAYVTRSVHLRGIVASLGFVILAWWIAALMVWTVNRFRWPEHRTRGLRYKFIAALLALVAILVAGAITLKRSEHVTAPVQMVNMLGPGASTVGDQRGKSLYAGFVVPDGEMVTRYDLRRAAGNQSSNASLARRMLDAIENAQEQPTSDAYLAAAFRDEAVSTAQTTTWRDDVTLLMLSKTTYERHADFDDVGLLAHQPGLAIERLRNWLTLRWVQYDPAEPTWHWRIDMVLLGCALVGLALLTMLLRTVTYGLPAAAVRWRVLRGRCGDCGYIVTAPKT